MRILFAGGGTGGGLFPSVAVADEVCRMAKETEVLFVGSSRGIERELAERFPYPIQLLPMGALKGKGFSQRILTLFRMPITLFRAFRILREFSPQAVFGSGGYAAFPIVFVGALMGIRNALIEPNAVPGVTNRVLGWFSKRVFLAFAVARKYFASSKCVWSGNPIRKDILAVPPPTFQASKKVILIFGGSQGARRLNQAMMGACAEFSPDEVRFIHQTGNYDLDDVRNQYQKFGFEADVRPFFDDMALAYSQSDIVIARAGSSVLEIVACGRPSLLVPYPYAADDHQTANAKALVEVGAAVCVLDHECTKERMAKELRTLLNDEPRLKEMSQKALSMRKEDAAKTIAHFLLSQGEMR